MIERKALRRLAPELPINHLDNESVELALYVTLDVAELGDDVARMNMSYLLETIGFSPKESAMYAQNTPVNPDLAYMVREILAA